MLHVFLTSPNDAMDVHVCVFARGRECVRVYVCACTYVSVPMYVCVCVRAFGGRWVSSANLLFAYLERGRIICMCEHLQFQ